MKAVITWEHTLIVTDLEILGADATALIFVVLCGGMGVGSCGDSIISCGVLRFRVRGVSFSRSRFRRLLPDIFVGNVLHRVVLSTFQLQVRRLGRLMLALSKLDNGQRVEHGSC
jgi:hypothetical protein